MDLRLIRDIDNKLTIIKMEEVLLKKALLMHKAGIRPENISSSSQFSAVTTKINRAANVEEAKEKVSAYLNKQMKKLLKKQKSDKKESWLREPDIGNESETLGNMVIDCIKNESYLPDKSLPNTLDRLRIMRRFWGFVSGLYNYRKTLEKGMPIKEE